MPSIGGQHILQRGTLGRAECRFADGAEHRAHRRMSGASDGAVVEVDEARPETCGKQRPQGGLPGAAESDQDDRGLFGLV
jgi:hypothetical protein